MAHTHSSSQRPTLLLLALLLLLVLATVATPPAAPVAAQGIAPTTTPTPQPDARPDSCEPNNDQAHACRLPLDAVSGPFTFLPEGDVDVYSVFLGAQPDGMQTTLTLRATSGLDLLTTVSRAEGGAALATIASPTISTTLAADVTGWAVLRVENRGAAIATGQSYRVELRRTLPPAPTASGPEGLARDPATPDALENNWSPETAAPIAVGVLYDLNFVCPVSDGCPGGDHDYLRVEVKAGGRYLISTFDLADGVDTVLDLFWWSADAGSWQLLTSNDDERAGAAFLSTIRWQVPADGIALIRVGPRSGGLNPILSAAPSYRLAIALAGSPLADQLEARIAAQTNRPTPTAAADAAAPAGSTGDGAAPAPVAPTAVVIESNAASGAALVTVETPAHTDPDAASPTLGSIPVDALVQLTGRVAGLWVEVEAPAIVGAAWVDRRVLRPTAPLAPTETLASSDTAARLPTSAGTLPAPAAATALAGPSPASLGATPIRALPTITLPSASPPAEPAAGLTTAHITARVVQGDQPVPGMRVILLTALDTILGQQVTADDGTVAFDVQIATGTRVDLALPALGMRVHIDAAAPDLIVALPAEAQ